MERAEGANQAFWHNERAGFTKCFVVQPLCESDLGDFNRIAGVMITLNTDQPSLAVLVPRGENNLSLYSHVMEREGAYVYFVPFRYLPYPISNHFH